MSGLDAEQLDELEYRVAGLLEEPWDKGEGRPRELTLREALVVTCGYMRQNIIEDVWADIFDDILPHISAGNDQRLPQSQLTRSPFSLIPWFFEQSGHAIFQLVKLLSIQS